MNITSISIRRPLTIVMLVAGLVIMGAVAAGRLPIRQYPNVQFPFSMVMVSYPGASPADVRTLITDPIENAIQSVSGIDTITGVSGEGSSRVAIQFDDTVDENVAANDVSQAVGRIASTLPTGASTPTVVKADPTAIPIMDIALGGRLTPSQLYTLSDNTIKPALSAIPGVASVNIVGGEIPQVNVLVNRNLLGAYHLALPQITSAIASQNVELPGGELESGSQSAGTRTQGYFQSLSGLADAPVVSNGLTTVPLRAVATVSNGLAQPTTVDRLNGHPAVGLTITAQSGANSIAVDDAVRQALTRLKRQLPPGLGLTVTGDTTSYTRQSLSAVETDLLLAILLTGLVLFAFLHRVRNTLIVLLAIPSSLVTTFLVMYFLNFSLDTVSLMALSLLIGILVDDSIVVLENIHRHRETLGEDAETAAYNGRMEIGGAALAITLTDVVVYAPMAFISGLVGQFFHEFGLTIVAATLLSLFISFTLTPMLASRWLVPTPPNESNLWARFGRWWETSFQGLTDMYARILGFALRHRPFVILIGLVALVGSISFIPLGWIGTDMMPSGDPGVLQVNATLPAGTSLAATDRVLTALSERIHRLPGVVDVFGTVGAGGGFEGSSSANTGQLTVDLVPKAQRKLSIDQVITIVHHLAAPVPGLKVTTSIPSGMGGGMGGQNIAVILQGPDLGELNSLATSFEEKLKRLPQLTELNSSAAPAQPELAIELNHTALAQYGIPAATVAQAVQTAVGGTTASEYRASYLPKEENIVVQMAGGTGLSIDQLAAIPIAEIGDQAVDLGQVASIQKTLGPVEIDEQNQQLEVQVSASLASGQNLGLATRAVQQVLLKFPLPAGYSSSFGGQVDQQSRAFTPLLGAFALSIILIYMLMVALYESILFPLAIIFSLPLATIGAFLGLLVTHNDFGMFAFIALIVLMGLVSKNAILLIDYTNQLRAQGVELFTALIQAGRVRLRPILMTTAVMDLAMLPIALKFGAGSETRAPMGAVLIGGLTTSTLLTLVFVPVLYSYLDALAQRWGSRRRKLPTGKAKESIPGTTPAESPLS